MLTNRFTLVELMIVVAIIAILSGIAVPQFIQMTYRARVTEGRINVEGIRLAQIAYEADSGQFLDLSGTSGAEVPRDYNGLMNSGKKAVDWSTGGPSANLPSTNWDMVGWRPDGPVRCTYWSTKWANDFDIESRCNVDNAGLSLIWDCGACKNDRPENITGPDTY